MERDQCQKDGGVRCEELAALFADDSDEELERMWEESYNCRDWRTLDLIHAESMRRYRLITEETA